MKRNTVKLAQKDMNVSHCNIPLSRFVSGHKFRVSSDVGLVLLSLIQYVFLRPKSFIRVEKAKHYILIFCFIPRYN